MRKLLVLALISAMCLMVNADFTVAFKVNVDGVKTLEKLCEVPGVVTISVRQANDGTAPSGYDTWLGNYQHFSTPDGLHTIIEAVMHDGERVGVPLGALKKPMGEHKVVFTRSKVKWRLYVDERIDEDFPREALPTTGANEAKAISERVKGLKYVSPALPEPKVADSKPITRPIQFWTPDDHDAWVGDVTIGYWKGRMHLFYLKDRRHHQSKGKGGGGHFFAHLSSADLVNWVEHPDATEIKELWESHGTGTPFEYNGNLCLAFGHHSERFVPIEKTTAPILEKWCAEHNGREGEFSIAKLGLVPVGGTYAYSKDGIHFKDSGILITRDENPSVYRRSDGRWGLGRGLELWVTDNKKSPTGWYAYDGKTGARGDCPMPFYWKGWHYLIQGFCFFSMSKTGEAGTWKERVTTEEHPYDGLSVPMVAPFGKDRMIIAGWVRFPGCWGGYLCLRELVQHADGTLGTKWLKEAPHAEKPEEFQIPKGGKLKLRYENVAAAHPLEFEIDATTRRAQFADVKEDGSVERQRTLAEVMSALELPKRRIENIKKSPDWVESYAVGNLRGLENGGKLRMVMHYDAKSNSTIFDAEIAGVRTMLAVRYGKFKLVK